MPATPPAADWSAPFRWAGVALTACWIALWYLLAFLASTAWSALKLGWADGRRPRPPEE